MDHKWPLLYVSMAIPKSFIWLVKLEVVRGKHATRRTDGVTALRG